MYFVSLITTCFHALLLTTPFVFTWVNSELFEFNKMLWVYGFTVIITALWLGRMVVERRVIWRKHPAVLLALVFLTGQAAATLFSIHFRTSLFGFYSRLNGGFFSSLAYALLLAALINNVPKKQRWSLLLTTALSAILAALYALPEHFGASPSCYLMKKTWTISCWKQNVQERVFGTFGQPNWLATFLVGVAPIVGLLATKARGGVRQFWLIGLALLVAVIWFTKSRSGLIGLGSVGLGWLILAVKPWWQPKVEKLLRPRWLKIGLLAVVISLILGVGFYFSQHIPVANVEDSFDLSQGTESGSIRLIVWRGALKVWQRYPLFGSGPGTFAYSYYQDRPVEHNLVSEWEHLYNKAHNELLNYLAETGLVGTITYLVFLGGLVWLLSRQLPKDKPVYSPAAAGLLSLIGLSVTNFFGFSTVVSNLLLFLLPAIGLLDQVEQSSKSAPINRWHKILLAAIFLISLSLIVSLTKAWSADRWYAQGKRLEEKLEYPAAGLALGRAIELIPNEPYYYDELANFYSKVSLAYALENETTASAQVGEAAIQSSNLALSINPRHLSFYKTRARVFLILAQVDRQYFAEAEKVLKLALELSPTDAQLWYNLGLVQAESGELETAVATLQKTIELKPNYVRARSQLGDLLVQMNRPEEAKAQYQFILDKLSPTDTEVQEKLRQLDE